MERGNADTDSVNEGGAPPGRAQGVDAGRDDAWWRCFAQISPVGIFRADLEGRCIFVNERWSEMTGYSAEEALGAGWAKAIHPEDVAMLETEWRRAVAEGRWLQLEHRYLQPGGRVVWVFAQAVAEHDDEGRIVSYVATVTDISELRKMRAELERSHDELDARVRERTMQLEHMAMIVATSDDAIIGSDFRGRIVSWNKSAEAIFGYTAEEMIGKSTTVITPADRLAEARGLKERVRSGETISQMETVRVARSGELIEVSLSIFGLRDATGAMIGTSGIVRDIRERKKAERRLRQLSWRLLRLQDEERRRIARDLHDSTAQNLAALVMNLSLLSGGTLPEEKRAAVLADSLALADDAVRELRTHAYLLHPPLLEERGLKAALEWLVEGFGGRSGIETKLEIAPDIERFSAEIEMTIFRVVQESLSNVRRHAKSRTAGIFLRREAGRIVLEIRDEGCGVPAHESELRGVGIAGMRERLAQLGGSLRLASDTSGTRVIAQIPESL